MTRERIRSRNQHLEGKLHPVTQVEFMIQYAKVGETEIEVVAPVFPFLWEMQLPQELLKSSNARQFAYCNKAYENTFLRKKPQGYTWHHAVTQGKMQLVLTEIHRKTGHTGGKSIWGKE